jgi:hypothetical protein
MMVNITDYIPNITEDITLQTLISLFQVPETENKSKDWNEVDPFRITENQEMIKNCNAMFKNMRTTN